MILNVISDMILWPELHWSTPLPPSAAPTAATAALLSLPSLSCLDPALADTLAPDPLGLCYGHHPGVAPAVVPHPDVHLVEPAAVAPVLLRVGGGASKTPIVLEAMWNRGVTVAANETLNEGVHPSTSATGQM